jgi:hypothetical protein
MESKSNITLIRTGYVMAVLSILILPIIFIPAGVAVGIVNISKGETGHGVAQIVLSVFLGLLGTYIGGAGLGL